MISVKDRAPLYPGRVDLSPVPGVPNRFDLARADSPTDPGTPINRRTMQLLQADIRTHPIAPGNTVSAGDVVDVVGGEVQQTWQGQTNVKNLIDISSSWISVSKLNDLHSVVAYYTSGSTQCRVSLINNATGANVGGILLLSGATSYITTARLSDSAFIVGRVYSNALSVILCTVSGTTITQVTSQAVSASTTDYNTQIPLSDTTFISVYNRAGLKAKVCTVSGSTITAGTEYSLSGSTSAAYISATLLPNAPNGDKRVCVCYSDAADSSKGKVVIATINASNVVTWGTPVVFESLSIGYTGCCTSGDDAVAVYNTNPFVRARVLSIIGTNITANGHLDVADGVTASYSHISAVGTGAVVSYTQTSSPVGGKSVALRRDGAILSKGPAFGFNASNSTYIATAAINDTQILTAFADAGNSNYATATILTVKGNQIAGSFTDISSQAIALQSGTEGQSIDIIYDGVAELPGITAGTQITSPGVQGYAPQEGWLWVKPEWDNAQCVFGTYIGNGNAEREILLGFKPAAVIVYAEDGAQFDATGNGSSSYGGFAMQGLPCIRSWDYSTRKEVVAVTATGFKVFYLASGSNAILSNEASKLRYYIAFRR